MISVPVGAAHLHITTPQHPEWVVVCHLLDEIDLVSRDLRPADCWAALPFPVQPEALPVPPDDGLGFGNEKSFPPGIV